MEKTPTFGYFVFRFDELSKEAQQRALKQIKLALAEIISDDELLIKFVGKLQAKFEENGVSNEFFTALLEMGLTKEKEMENSSKVQNLEQIEKEHILKALNNTK